MPRPNTSAIATYTPTQMADSRSEGSWGRLATKSRSISRTPSRPTRVSAQTRFVTAMVNLRVRTTATDEAAVASVCGGLLHPRDHAGAHGAGIYKIRDDEHRGQGVLPSLARRPLSTAGPARPVRWRGAG